MCGPLKRVETFLHPLSEDARGPAAQVGVSSFQTRREGFVSEAMAQIESQRPKTSALTAHLNSSWFQNTKISATAGRRRPSLTSVVETCKPPTAVCVHRTGVCTVVVFIVRAGTFTSCTPGCRQLQSKHSEQLKQNENVDSNWSRAAGLCSEVHAHEYQRVKEAGNHTPTLRGRTNPPLRFLSGFLEFILGGLCLDSC